MIFILKGGANICSRFIMARLYLKGGTQKVLPCLEGRGKKNLGFFLFWALS